jgi:hypothetical protein
LQPRKLPKESQLTSIHWVLSQISELRFAINDLVQVERANDALWGLTKILSGLLDRARSLK